MKHLSHWGVFLAIFLTTLFYSAVSPLSGYAQEGSNEINVRNADLSAIIKIFSKKTKRNYILDEAVKGKVSIFLPGQVSDAESIRILEAILSLKGFTSVPIGENLWKIVKKGEAKQSTIPTMLGDSDEPATAAMVTRLIRLKHVDAEDMQKLLAQLISGDGLINAYARTNSLLIVDSEDNIKRLVELVNAVDIAASDRDVTVIPITYADATEVATTISEILGQNNDEGGGGSSAGSSSSERSLEAIRARIRESRNSNGKDNNSASASAASLSISARSAPANIIPDERTNSIIVVADETETARIRALVDQLDSQIDLSGNRFYVYRCQHATAEELADVLGGLTGQGGSSGSGTSSTGGLNSQRDQRGASSQRTQDRLSSSQRTPGRSRSESTGSSGGATTVNLGEDISITADPSTNSLIIASNRAEYLKIIELLKQLDVKRRQVLVEAILLEVGLSGTESQGAEWSLSLGGDDGGLLTSANYGNLSNLFTDPTALSDFSIAAASAGTLTLPSGAIPTQTVLLNLARTNTNVNVLSAPSILATDNEEAEIVVGQNVPFVASTSTNQTNLNNTFNQIDRQDVGITLRLTPQISSHDSVTLRIFTEVSNVVPDSTNSALGPTTTLRTSETTAISKDGQMVVIGGLMSDDVSDTVRGIPFLMDIPVLGQIFRVDGETHTRTNLLIFIKPRIVKDQFDHRDITVDMRNKLESTINTLNSNPTREEILRSPSIDEVASTPEMYEGNKPSTIRGSGTNQLGASNTASGDSEQFVELRVAPKLPEPKAQFSNRATSTGTGTGSSQQSSNQYLVFEKVSRAALPAGAPFDVSSSNSIGVQVPTEGVLKTDSFFSVGSVYNYMVDNQTIPLKLAGAYDSNESAVQKHPDLGLINWHPLSPYEIMRLGQAPWKKK